MSEGQGSLVEGKYLIFTVEGRSYALRFSDVRTIIAADPSAPPKPVPDLPDYVAGTIVNDGRVITVISLRRRFGCTDRPLTDRDCIMVTDTGRDLALLCDSILGFREIPEEEIQPAPDINEQVNARFLLGEFLLDGEVCWIVSPELVIRPDDEAAFDKYTD